MSGSPLLQVVRDPRLWRGSALGAVMLLVAANVAIDRWSRSLAAVRQENLLTSAGQPWAGMRPRSGGAVRYDESVGENLEAYWPCLPDARKCRSVILCGMSQLYAVNERQTGDETISECLDDKLAPSGVRVFGLAAPNLCNEEALLLLLAAAAEAKTRPAVFVYAVCFDKFRNVDLRPGYRAFLHQRPELAALWSATARRYADRYPAAAEKMRSTAKPVAAESDRPDTLETRLRRAAECLPMVRARGDLNAAFQMLIYRLRNAVLGITPTSKRPILQARYDLNRQFLGLMADVAQAYGVQLATYVVPLNPQAENPYVAAEYTAFKSWYDAFTHTHRLRSANLESLVPAEEWGLFNGGPDFKHFKGSAHRRTAEALLIHFGDLFRAERSGRVAH
jgi:hypothetical protein